MEKMATHEGLLLALGAMLLLALMAIVGGLKRLGCVNAQACPPLGGLALAGLLLVGLRLVV